MLTYLLRFGGDRWLSGRSWYGIQSDVFLAADPTVTGDRPLGRWRWSSAVFTHAPGIKARQGGDQLGGSSEMRRTPSPFASAASLFGPGVSPASAAVPEQHLVPGRDRYQRRHHERGAGPPFCGHLGPAHRKPHTPGVGVGRPNASWFLRPLLCDASGRYGFVYGLASNGFGKGASSKWRPIGPCIGESVHSPIRWDKPASKFKMCHFVRREVHNANEFISPKFFVFLNFSRFTGFCFPFPIRVF